MKNLASGFQRFLLILPGFPGSFCLKFSISKRHGQTCFLVCVHNKKEYFFRTVRIIQQGILEPGAGKKLAQKDHLVRKLISLHDIFSI